jgi:Ca2+-binding EF-hand superfamily protein
MDVVEYDRRGWQMVKKSNKQSLFKIVDENNDGEITKEEFQKVMDSMNKNNDDRLEAYELQAWILEHL